MYLRWSYCNTEAEEWLKKTWGEADHAMLLDAFLRGACRALEPVAGQIETVCFREHLMVKVGFELELYRADVRVEVFALPLETLSVPLAINLREQNAPRIWFIAPYTEIRNCTADQMERHTHECALRVAADFCRDGLPKEVLAGILDVRGVFKRADRRGPDPFTRSHWSLSSFGTTAAIS